MADAVEPEGNVAKDLFAGACGGIAQVLLGQPFDIVKVRLQTSSQYSNALDCAKNIWKHEGPAAFYKGTLTPLVGIGACVSVQFGAFHAARRFFESQNAAVTTSPTPSPNTLYHAAPLTYTQYYAAGAFAGLTNSVLSGPIEHVRIRLQTQPHVADPSKRLYAGPISCIRTLVREAGVARGLYRGQAVTLLREAQAYGVWFLTYEFLMNGDVKRRKLGGREQVEAWRLALYGGVAGEMLWLSSYPFDVVKSKMQTDGLIVARSSSEPNVAGKGGTIAEVANAAFGKGAGAEMPPASNIQAAIQRFGTQRYSSMRECFAKTYRDEGLRGFWRGIGPTLVRALPVSGATFLVAEMTLRLISR